MICGCECWYLAESVIEATRVNKSIESRWIVSFFSKRIVVTSKWYRVNTHYMRLNRMLEWYAFGAYVITCFFLSSIYTFFRCCCLSLVSKVYHVHHQILHYLVYQLLRMNKKIIRFIYSDRNCSVSIICNWS